MGMNDHPDVARALLTGYPTFVDDENRDSEENRMAFFEDCPNVLLEYLKENEPDALERCIEFREREYRAWLN